MIRQHFENTLKTAELPVREWDWFNCAQYIHFLYFPHTVQSKLHCRENTIQAVDAVYTLLPSCSQKLRKWIITLTHKLFAQYIEFQDNSLSFAIGVVSAAAVKRKVLDQNKGRRECKSLATSINLAAADSRKLCRTANICKCRWLPTAADCFICTFIWFLLLPAGV